MIVSTHSDAATRKQRRSFLIVFPATLRRHWPVQSQAAQRRCLSSFSSCLGRYPNYGTRTRYQLIGISCNLTGSFARLFSCTIILSFRNRIIPGPELTPARPVPKYAMTSLRFSSAFDVAANPIAQQRIQSPASSTRLKVRFSLSVFVNCISDNSDTTPRIDTRNGGVAFDRKEIYFVTHTGGSGGGSNTLPT